MRKKIADTLRIALPVLLFGFILYTYDMGEVWTHIRNISPIIWIVALLLSLLLTTLAALRLYIVVGGIKYSSMLYVRLVSSAYGFVLPGFIVAAEGVRIYMLGKAEGKYSSSSAAVLMDKVIGLIAMLILGVFGLMLAVAFDTRALFIMFLVGVAGLIVTLLMFMIPLVSKMSVRFLSVLSQKKDPFGKIFGFFLRVLKSWIEYANNRKILMGNFVCCFVFHICYVLLGAVLSYGAGAGFLFFDWLWIHAVLTFAFMLPLSFGAIGLREGALIWLLGILGVGAEQALAVSFGFLGMQLVFVLVGFGLEIYVKGRRA